MIANRSVVGCLASLSLAAAALTSCASGGGGSSIAFDDLESETVAVACRFNVACGAFPDEATCRATIVPQDGFYPTMRADIASGRVIYDGASARECLDLFAAGVSPCTQTAVTALFLSLDTVCAGVFTGTGAPGAQCFFDEECANRGVCDATTTCTLGCCPGTCVTRPPPIPVGGNCATALPDQSCAQGSLCTFNPTGTAATCTVPTAGEGASCSAGSACMTSLYCAVPEGQPNAAVCARPSGRGGACSQDSFRSCDDVRDGCADDNTCQPLIPVGGACAGTSLDCVRYATCDGTTCVALGKVGEPCDPGSYGTCLPLLTCDSTGHCAAAASGGGACR